MRSSGRNSERLAGPFASNGGSVNGASRTPRRGNDVIVIGTSFSFRCRRAIVRRARMFSSTLSRSLGTSLNGVPGVLSIM